MNIELLMKRKPLIAINKMVNIFNDIVMVINESSALNYNEENLPHTTLNKSENLEKYNHHIMNHRYRRRPVEWREFYVQIPAIFYTKNHHSRFLLTVVVGILLVFVNIAQAEYVRDMDVSEGVPVGHQIGYIGEHLPGVDSGPPYLIVPVPGSGVDTDLNIDHNTGEIRTKIRLDRETRASYSLVAIPLSGDNVRVLVRVLDENDNAPTFPMPVMYVEFPENTPRDVKRTLHPARDLDLGRYNTQRYNIISGNLNNAYRLSSHRERDGVLYLDLQINGVLDRETTPFYNLVIEALDGGNPPLRGQMTVNITIQDVNDNQPIFNQSRYFATVPENITVGTAILQVYATDDDSDENGLVEYFINRRQSDKEQIFSIDSNTGWITVSKPLDFEKSELHELVVVAKDRGEIPLETTAFISIRVTDINDNQPIINVIFLSDDATPKISESAQPGEFVARISVNDPDSKTEYANVNVSLNGGNGHFGLTTRDNIIYLVIVNMTLDRESTANYTLSVVATDNGTPPLHASKIIHLKVTDINDNAPEFERDVYQTYVTEISEPGTSVIQVQAYDRDEGSNSAVLYSLLNTTESYSHWFQIESHTGLITTKTHVDCETEPVPQLIVVATDTGRPPLSSTATVQVTIHDVNDNEPIFEKTYYNITIAESEAVGHCILKVSANDPDCGVNAMVNYTLGIGNSGSKSANTNRNINKNNHSNNSSLKNHHHLTDFEVRSASGDICVRAELDYERRSSYEFPIISTDRGGLSTTSIVKIQLTDNNDNRPIFYPQHYNITISEMAATTTSTTPILFVKAHDPDSGRFGSITYRIVSGNEASIFRIDRATGELYINRPTALAMRIQSIHRLNITASDGGGLRTSQDALAFVSIIDATQRPPIFQKMRYNFYVKENVNSGTVIGSIIAVSADAVNSKGIRYLIYTGDPENYFNIDEITGSLRVSNNLDHEVKSEVLLNIKAYVHGFEKKQGFTQVLITVEDVNDNAPKFESEIVHLSVPENAELGKPLYVITAYDKDSGANGEITYELAAHHSSKSISDTGFPNVEAATTLLGNNSAGSLLHKKQINVTVNATNVTKTTAYGWSGSNSNRRSSSLSNENTSLLNADITTNKDIFVIDVRSGQLELLRHLDYETFQQHILMVTAWDAGKPTRLSANLTIIVNVQDINDNPPIFEHNEYNINVMESQRVHSQILKVTAVDVDTGNNARITYRILNNNNNNNNSNNNNNNHSRQTNNAPNRSLNANKNVNNNKHNNNNHSNMRKLQEISSYDFSSALTSSKTTNSNNVDIADGLELFGVYANSGWIYLRSPLDRETRDHYELTVVATDNGTPPAQTHTRVLIHILDANDNDPHFLQSSYEFRIEENLGRGSLVGVVTATDRDLAENAAIRYHLIPTNSSFHINSLTGEISIREALDREQNPTYDLVAEARDQGTPYRSARVTIKVDVTDVNDNAPDIIDPQEDVVSVREQQPVGTEVVRIRAVDRDYEQNASITYSILKGRDSDGFGLFSIDDNNGIIRTSVVLDHEERSIYRLAVAATDGGKPPKQSIRLLRVEVLSLNDNRPTFTSSSLTFRIPEDKPIGEIVGSLRQTENKSPNIILNEENLFVTYTVTALSEDIIEGAFDIDRRTSSLIIARSLDREMQSEFQVEIRSLDTSVSNNPQSSAVTVKIEITDINDNAPIWPQDPITIRVSELAQEGTVIYNFTAMDEDAGLNGQVQYELVSYSPKLSDHKNNCFTVDLLTGRLTLTGPLDYETIQEYILIVKAFDVPENINERLHTTVTVSILIQDENDNRPEFVVPTPILDLKLNHTVPSIARLPISVYQASVSIYISDSKRVGEICTHIIAIDKDSGDNGRLAYSIESGNDLKYFRINSVTGYIELAKPLPPVNSAYTFRNHNSSNGYNTFDLIIKVQDHGIREMKSTLLNLKIVVQSTKSNPPRFLQNIYYANVSENAHVGSFVVQVMAKVYNGRNNVNLTYEIPVGIADNLFHIDSQLGVVTTRGQFDREIKASYTLPIYVYETKRQFSKDEFSKSVVGRQQRSHLYEPVLGSNKQFDVATLHITIIDVNDHAPEFRPGTCYQLHVPENSDLAVIHTVVATDLDDNANGEIFYNIIGGNIGNKFSLDMHTGELTARPLDREQQNRYALQIQASDRGAPINYQGYCNITVNVGDQNDNDPHFEKPKYTANIAEDVAIGTSVLKVKAVDDDLGLNARLMYTLANESQSLFAVDNKTGVITTTGALDRESQYLYNFIVVATDGGYYDARSAHVPIQIIVDDVNDNIPIFEQYPFRSQVPALIQPGQTLLQIQAFDRDIKQNAEILYSVNDEKHSSLHNRFRINPKTGALSSTQSLASESGRLLHVEIIAKDRGNPALHNKGLVEIRVGEVPASEMTLKFQNDTYRVKISENSLVGTSILQVQAVRSDGRRSKLHYSLKSGIGKEALNIDSNTGEIRVANMDELDYEKYSIKVTDSFYKGTKTTTTSSALNYRGRALPIHGDNITNATIATETTSDALRDNKNLRANRAFKRHEKESLPVLVAADSEPHELRLMLVARSESHVGSSPLYAYAELIVELEDVNDNIPQFTQSQYAANVWEGNNKGTFVIQVNAYDADSGANARILYHIVDGNHDNAFVIEPAFSGIVKTNIVLDREIRDIYKLKILATDEGVPQMTGTATIHVHIVDVNDNQPTFPPHNIVSVSEASELGSIITTVSANDVDTYPSLTYRFTSTLSNNQSVAHDILSMFAIDRYSGKIVLKQHLDYEERQEYQLEVIASDAAHEAHTTLTVRIKDENDNAPEFDVAEPPAYLATLPDISTVSSTSDIELLIVNATDKDSKDSSNSKIIYSIQPQVPGFVINENTGAILVNLSRLFRLKSESLHENFYATIVATDMGLLPLKTSITLKIQSQGTRVSKAQFLQTHYKASINEAAPLGTVVLRLGQDILETLGDLGTTNFILSVLSGNEGEVFEVLPSYEIILVKNLNRELMDLYKLRLVVTDSSAIHQQLTTQAMVNSTSAINVFITVEDNNDNAPEFAKDNKYEAEISELAPLRSSVNQLQAVDSDAPNTPNSEVVYEIISGNDEGMFTIDLISGILFVNNDLDYDTGGLNYKLIIRACDSANQPLCTLKSFNLVLKDENDNAPKFPIEEYMAFVAENEPLETSIFQAQANDLDRGVFGILNYSIHYKSVIAGDNAELFQVNSQTGIVTTNTIFDYEQCHMYDIVLRATDLGGKYATAKVRVQIDSRDEFAPQFTERTYRFVMPVPVNDYLPVGFTLGRVVATDKDKGPDGRITYQLNTQHTHFKINRTTGSIALKKTLKDNFDKNHDISLFVTASSGRQGSLTNMTVVEILLDPLADFSANVFNKNDSNLSGNGENIGNWFVGIIISALLLVCAVAGILLFIYMRKSKPNRNTAKPHLGSEPVGNSNSYVDPSAFDTMPARNAVLPSLNVAVAPSTGAKTTNSVAAGQFAPPKYDEIPPYINHAASSNSGAATTSELSGSEQSGSSGRGSAEDDGEDEEIRMINEGPLRSGSSTEGGRLSNISVQNTQEYLARLGIIDRDTNGVASSSSVRGSNKEAPHLHHTLPLHIFDEVNPENDITNLIYAKLNEVNPTTSNRGGTTEEDATTACSIGTSIGHVINFSNTPVVNTGSNVGPPMNGSLSSIVHSEQELTGSYNWDYLLDWGPQYQPLAHVFSEIARLKDDTISVHNDNSGGCSSNKCQQSLAYPMKGLVKPHIPPPLLTNVAPRTINLPVLSGSGVNVRIPKNPPHMNGSSTSTQLGPQYMLPRSPISLDATGGFSTSSAMSPSFSPSLSPLATRSPSISPLGGVSSSHHLVNLTKQQQSNTRNKNVVIEQVRDV